MLEYWPKIATKTEDEFDEYIAELGLLHSKRSCPSCGSSMRLSAQKDRTRLKWECYKRTCRQPGIKRKIGFTVDTFFERSTSERKKIFLLAHYYACELGMQKTWTQLVRLEENCISQWCQYFRDVICDYYNGQNVMLGGLGSCVQIDESLFVKRKYNRGRPVREGWVFGMIEEGTKRVVVKFVAKRDAATLIPIIQQHVRVGTTIKSDEWRAYGSLGNLGYTHLTVNHSVNFVDPQSGAHTQAIESLWSHLKRRLRRYVGLNGEYFEDKLLEVVWHFQHENSPKVYEFWSMVADQYPCE